MKFDQNRIGLIIREGFYEEVTIRANDDAVIFPGTLLAYVDVGEVTNSTILYREADGKELEVLSENIGRLSDGYASPTFNATEKKTIVTKGNNLIDAGTFYARYRYNREETTATVEYRDRFDIKNFIPAVVMENAYVGETINHAWGGESDSLSRQSHHGDRAPVYLAQPGDVYLLRAVADNYDIGDKLFATQTSNGIWVSKTGEGMFVGYAQEHYIITEDMVCGKNKNRDSSSPLDWSSIGRGDEGSQFVNLLKVRIGKAVVQNVKVVDYTATPLSTGEGQPTTGMTITFTGELSTDLKLSDISLTNSISDAGTTLYGAGVGSDAIRWGELTKISSTVYRVIFKSYRTGTLSFKINKTAVNKAEHTIEVNASPIDYTLTYTADDPNTVSIMFDYTVPSDAAMDITESTAFIDITQKSVVEPAQGNVIGVVLTITRKETGEATIKFNSNPIDQTVKSFNVVKAGSNDVYFSAVAEKLNGSLSTNNVKITVQSDKTWTLAEEDVEFSESFIETAGTPTLVAGTTNVWNVPVTVTDSGTTTISIMLIDGDSNSTFPVNNGEVEVTVALVLVAPTITATPYSDTYDGNPHIITLGGTEAGDTIKYSLDGQDYYSYADLIADSSKKAQLTNATTNPITVYYKVDRTGYLTATGSSTVTINKATVTITGTTVANKTYNGNTDASVTVGTVNGIVNNEFTIDATGTFASSDFSPSPINVNVTYTAVGNSAVGTFNPDNYIIPTGETLQAYINEDSFEFTVDNGGAEYTYDKTAHPLELSGVEEDDDITYVINGGSPTKECNPIDAGTYTIQVTVTRKNKGFQKTTTTLTIKPKEVTVSGSTVADKQYDGTTNATVSNIIANGIISGDDCQVTYTGTFASKDASEDDQVVSITYALDGTNAANYTLKTKTGTANAKITKAVLLGDMRTPNAITYGDKVYSGSDFLPVKFTRDDNKDEVELDPDSDFWFRVNNQEDPSTGCGVKNAGTYKVTAETRNPNYKWSGETGDFVINKKQIEITDFLVDNKEYDGTTEATSHGKIIGILSSDSDVSDNFIITSVFESAEVGEHKVTTTFTINPGYDVNYKVPATRTDKASITAKTIAYSADGFSGNYDGFEHGIVVDVTDPAGAVVKYGTEKGKYDSTTSPTYTSAGTYTVYFQITADNYQTVTGSKQVEIKTASGSKITYEINRVDGSNVDGSAATTTKVKLTLSSNPNNQLTPADFTVTANGVSVLKADQPTTFTGTSCDLNLDYSKLSPIENGTIPLTVSCTKSSINYNSTNYAIEKKTGGDCDAYLVTIYYGVFAAGKSGTLDWSKMTSTKLPYYRTRSVSKSSLPEVEGEDNAFEITHTLEGAIIDRDAGYDFFLTTWNGTLLHHYIDGGTIDQVDAYKGNAIETTIDGIKYYGYCAIGDAPYYNDKTLTFIEK